MSCSVPHPTVRRIHLHHQHLQRHAQLPGADRRQWLGTHLPQILASPQYTSGTTAVFLTFDEDDFSPINQVLTVAIAPALRPRTAAAAALTHYSLLRTTEEMLGLGYLGGARSAGSMRSAFGI